MERRHDDETDNPLNTLTSILNVFYYSLIITCVLCKKVGEGFEFSREELGVKDEQHIFQT